MFTMGVGGGVGSYILSNQSQLILQLLRIRRDKTFKSRRQEEKHMIDVVGVFSARHDN